MTSFSLDPRIVDGEPAGWTVKLDGHDVGKALVGLELGIYAGQTSRHATGDPGILLTLSPGRDAHVGIPDADVRVDADTEALLRRLGWTPPKRGAR